jgi:hypothetical protein
VKGFITKRFGRSRWLTALSAAVVLALAVGTTQLVTAAPALAASCYSWSCAGLDPHQTGCDADAVTIDDMTLGGYIELRHSYNCWTAWARYTSSTSYMSYEAGIVGIDNNGNEAASYWVPITAPGGWTPMISFDLWSKACGFASPYTDCTAAH